MHELKLWKVIGVKNKDIKEQNISTEEEIVQKLHGKEMELDELFTGPSQQGISQVTSIEDAMTKILEEILATMAIQCRP
ncbi:hypothetical protein C1645_873645 [Glomus cerebriforme]|uniref:Uncharacterized protein n=1 Tax=Glomus cerebriforme TaxID=658196 RepID=A0A397TCE6_9GLOM|nr:hypothetical protein C1645_873645 [Glomus cerebriforme]